ncbi:helix-turn-helix domain-containing protein [Bacillus sp. FJAT-29937]|uniref:helix-turn-helix domain-containing protein n=1 Tax=Bacillus sp. FJAT-29937 TaxID=1720553 RepID=UPI00082FC1FE|nr:helix-turn-helix transcriptional regulator [Bacillus sp. FJAT-29937]
MLGERIRKLRKQKKMTLEELAGAALTKGMLSLIENNKANPSIESLHYIAEQLGVEVSDLLEEFSFSELREVLEKAEELYSEVGLRDSENTIIHSEKLNEIIAIIEPYVANLTNGYVSARLLDIYSRCLHKEKISGWEKFSEQASVIYDQMNLTSRRADIGIFRAIVKFIELNYEQSLAIFLSERAKIEAHHAYIDPKTRLDLDYHEAVLYFSAGHSEEAAQVLENAFAYSKKHRIFYLIDDLYRLAAGYAMITKNEERKLYYSKKLKQYGEFADDMFSILFYEFLMIDTLISEKQQYEEAIEKINQCLSDPNLSNSFKHYFFLEEGKALYKLSRNEEALQSFEKIEIPSYIHHPFDLSLFYVMDSYKALCHLNLENWDDAFQLAKKAVKNFDQLPSNSLKEFANETFDLINENSKQ